MKDLTPYTPNMTTCKLCFEAVSDGIHLSNGEMIHESCLDSVQVQEQEIRNEIIAPQDNLNKLRGEIERREGLVFKIASIFSKPEVDTAEMEKSIPIIESTIRQLSSALRSLQARVTPIYDYFLTYPPDWEKRRNEVAERDGEQCSKCSSWRQLHLHHIKPLSKGGSNKISNLTLLCEDCHSKKHEGKAFSGEFSNSETAFSKRVANIRYAIKNGERIRFGYKKPRDKSHKQRTVIPTELVNVDHVRDSGSTLCVRGHCELRKAERVFALKRMRGLKVV